MERLKHVGQIQPKAANQVSSSRLGIGFEKLDRNVFDPTKAYDKIADIGVKWVRIQSGWERTEKSKGTYDFEWIDDIVNNLFERGMKVWICLCYGNPLYSKMAKEYFGSVGCPPLFSQEEKQGWSNYVKALVSRYKDKVDYFEVWNEPDGLFCWKHGVSATEYGHFATDTAKAVKEANPDAKVIGFATCSINLPYMSEAFANTDMAKWVDAVSFHRYHAKEKAALNDISALRALCNQYNPNIQIIQGESGGQSYSKGAGAMSGGAWTADRQARHLLRNRMVDLSADLLFTSHFTSVDMIEALNGLTGDVSSYLDYGYFGVLGADFDEKGHSIGTYNQKPAYYALQTLASVFREEYEIAPLPIKAQQLESRRLLGLDVDDSRLFTSSFKRENGSSAFAYWNGTELLTTTYEGTISFVAGHLFKEVKLIDLMDGKIYQLPPEMIETRGPSGCLLKNIPIKDYPLLLSFDGFENPSSF